jgi:chromosome segregation ATPase
LAKDAVSDTRGALKRLEGRKYDEEIEEATQTLADNQSNLDEHSQRCGELLTKISENEAEVVRLQTVIEQTPTKLVDITNVKRSLGKKAQSLIATSTTNATLKQELKLNERAYEVVCAEIDQFDAEDLNQKKARILELEALIKDEQRTLESKRKDYKRIVKKQKLLDSVPCGTSFPACRFIADAHTAVAGIPELTAEANGIKAVVANYSQELSDCNPDAVREYLNNYEAKLHEKIDLSSTISDTNLKIERNIATITRLKREIADLNSKKSE